MARTRVAETVREQVAGVVSRVRRSTRRGTQPEPKEMQAQRGRPRLEPLSVDRQWFVEQLRRRKLSQSELARLLHKDSSTITHILTGAHRIKLDDAVSVAGILRTDIATVLRKLGYDVSSHNATIRGAVKGNGQITAISPRSGSAMSVTVPPAATSALICEARTDPMAAYDGAVFLYAEAEGPGSYVPPDAIGRLCIVEAADQVVPLLGVLSKGPARTSPFTLHPLGGGDAIPLRDIYRAMPVLAIHFA